MEIRLQKFLSQAGIASRRQSEELILNNKIKVNGKISNILGTKIDPEKDIIEYNGKVVKVDAEKVYYAINKPVGYVATTNHDQDVKIVTDLAPQDIRLYPVGRLDKLSQGLIILTNDGELAQELTHPKFNHAKEYFIIAYPQDEIKSVAKIQKALSRFEKGVAIDKNTTVTAQVKDELIDPSNFKVSFNLILTSGLNHQIRKMTEKIGLSIVLLKRIRINKLLLGELKTGECKLIAKSDII